MKLTATLDFAAPCERVYAMSVDPDFLARACLDLSAIDPDIQIDPPADAGTTRVQAGVESPGALARFTGPTVRIMQVMAWGPAAADGSRTARLDLAVEGLPLQVDAEARLAPTASGCTLTYDGEVTVRVPLLGPTIEKHAAPFVLETLQLQQSSGAAWLASHA